MFYVLLFCLVNAAALKNKKKVLVCANNLAIKNFLILIQSFLTPAIFYYSTLLSHAMCLCFYSEARRVRARRVKCAI